MPSVIEGTTILRSKHVSRKVIAGIDIAQRLSGISLKLLAFERLLTDYPIWHDKLVMIQKCLIPGSRLEDEARTMQEVRYLVKRIKDKFGPHVIDCQEIVGSSLPIDQRLSLWKVADVLMVTPIREGLNLLPLEFVFTKKKPAAPGVIISSEFSAVSSVLNGALRVNPFDIQVSYQIHGIKCIFVRIQTSYMDIIMFAYR
jgi:trehalose-6-phosphate synthase